MKLDSLKMISYCILVQNYCECIDNLINLDYNKFGKGKNKQIYSNFEKHIFKHTQDMIKSLFSDFGEKGYQSARNVDNLFNIVIDKNRSFNRKFLRIKTDTDNLIIPNTFEYHIELPTDLIYDKFLLLSDILKTYHKQHIEPTPYKNKSLNNQIVVINNMFKQHFSISVSNNFYQQFTEEFLKSDINKQLLFYENTLNHLRIENNL